MESRYFKRDISWLSFNYRVLLEAEDDTLPLYERINFISIYSSNLEEFYKIRVADHKAIATGAAHSDEESVQSAMQLVSEINEEVNRQLEERIRIYEQKILPAGKLEKGEDPFEAAKRELGEECGLTADNYISLGQFFPTVGYDTEVIYTWVATGLHKTQMHLDADEFLTPDRVPLDKAYEMVMSGEIRDGKTIAGILKLKALIAEGRL